MYCPRCGVQIADGSTFCSSCGANLAAPPPPVYPNNPPYGGAPYNSAAYKQKSAGLALLLALLFPGAGHLYAGKIVRGIVFMLSFFALGVTTYLVWWYYFIPTEFVADWPFSNWANSNLVIFTVIFVIVAVILWMVQLIDAYNVTKKYNAELMATGREPW